MRIVEDDLSGADIRALLELHFAGMRASSPPESCHFLDFDGLKAPGVTFWSVWEQQDLLGCGALKELAPDHGEVKSMRTHPDKQRRGAAAALLQHIMSVSVLRGYHRLSLETGSTPDFEAAHRLYLKHGFRACPPFAAYTEDPFSRYFCIDLPS